MARTGSSEDATSAGRECVLAAIERKTESQDNPVHPFTGSLNDYPHYKTTEPVTIGNWTYKINRMAPLSAIKPVHNSEFSLGDPTVMVAGIELSVRINSDHVSRLPAFSVVTPNIVLDQFRGYIDRALTPDVILDPGESIRGVVAFDCCVFSSIGDEAYLRVLGEPGNEKLSALIEITESKPKQSQSSDSSFVVIHKVDAEYTEAARKAKYAGSVKVNFVIDEGGNVTDIKIVDSPGFGMDDQIIKALNQWKFKPAQKGGVPVKAPATVTMTFKNL